jgi:hypothetical protein
MLTTAQQAIFKADVEADSAFASLPHNSDGAYAIAVAYQAEASPSFYVWRTEVTQDEIMQNGFDWTRVDNLSVGKARIWEWMFTNQDRSFNPSKPNVRAGIEAVWVGTAADLAVRAAVYLHCQRTANRLEKLFSSGTGTAMPGGSPATMAVEGSLSYSDVQAAMGW